MRNWIKHPLVQDQSDDSPEILNARRQVIQSKPFLMRIYRDWYQWILQALPRKADRVLELGSGMGFLNDYIPGLITSDIVKTPGISLVLDARKLPFIKEIFNAIVMIDVLHHIPNVKCFFNEVVRTLKPGGLLILLEPWNTAWSYLIYSHFHPEPFLPNTPHWEFESTNPLTSANGALCWILFERDRVKFEGYYPTLEIMSVRPFMPFLYLLSGGISYRSFQPGWSYPFWKWVEDRFSPWFGSIGMFVKIIIRRDPDD